MHVPASLGGGEGVIITVLAGDVVVVKRDADGAEVGGPYGDFLFTLGPEYYV